jgi:hypothetical protein
MASITDYRGVLIRITAERKTHILEHPELSGMEPAIEETIKKPEQVVRSQSDDKALLYYRLYRKTPVGEKYLCAVVKEGPMDSFLLTAYLTDRIKKGEMIWKRK